MVDSWTSLTGRNDAGNLDDEGQPTTDPNIPVRTPERAQAEPEPDRVSVLWHAKYYILAVVVVVAVIVYAVSTSLTPVYSSSSTVRVAATQAPGGSASDVAAASNSLAAQYVELVNSSAVMGPAALSAHTSASNLSTHISAGTVSSQNLVRITAQSSHPAQAEAWANAAAKSLAAYITLQSAGQAKAIQSSVNSQLAPINAQIASLQRSIASQSAAAVPGTAGYLTLQSEENQLTELLASRAGLLTTTAVSIAADQPQVQVLTSASPPNKVSPKPGLYTLIAAAGALLVAGEVALVGARRRFRSDRQ
jgi:capsular polysaccharide biosynthesis protein